MLTFRLIVCVLAVMVGMAMSTQGETVLERQYPGGRSLTIEQVELDLSSALPEIVRPGPSTPPTAKVVPPVRASLVVVSMVTQAQKVILYSRIALQYHMSDREYRPLDARWQDGGEMILLAQENLVPFSLTLVSPAGGSAQVAKVLWDTWLPGHLREQALIRSSEPKAEVMAKLLVDDDGNITVEVTDNRPYALEPNGTPLKRRLEYDRERGIFSVHDQGAR